jgi:hypothetical protein
MAGVCLGVLLNERVLAQLTPDGRIDAQSRTFVIRLFDVAAILCGGLTILFHRHPIVLRLWASASIALVSLLFFDWCLYRLSPRLPERVVHRMSPQAKLRYWRAHAEGTSRVYREAIRYVRPETEVREYGITVKSDRLGYRNPSDALAVEHGVDVILLGDSFTWGTESATIADFLRKEMAPRTVYSLGMGGEGIPHWRHHLDRFLSSTSYERPPKMVILNFYSGNDVTDTNLYLSLRGADGVVDSREYFAYLHHSYLVPLRARWTSSVPKLPEFFFLAEALFFQYGSGTVPRLLQIDDRSVAACMAHREPRPEHFTAEVLSELEATVVAIKAAAPGSRIVLSYIPTSGGIYGDLMAPCPDHADDVARQVANSRLLSRFSAGLSIAYVDVTPELRKVERPETLWSAKDHFSLEGYRLYASLLAERVALDTSRE